MAFDCEYTDRGSENELLSYQLAWATIDGGYYERIWYPPTPTYRPSFEEILELVHPTLPQGQRAPRICAIAHNGLAELAHLRLSDPPLASNERGNNRMRFIGKNPTTFRPLELQLAEGPVRVDFRDTMLLAAAGQKSLKQLASQNVVHSKIDLRDEIRPEHAALGAAIERMDLLLELDPELYERYALGDAQATLEYYLRFMATATELFGLTTPPLTAVGMGQAAYLRATPANKSPLGARRAYGGDGSETRPIPDREHSENLATSCYHGGMNTAFRYGFAGGPGRLVLDVDMAGAYATAMASEDEIRWAGGKPSLDLEELLAADYAFACVDFSFPEDTWNPCLPVAGESMGLIYPLNGVSHCAGPELRLAKVKGARMRVIQGYLYPSAGRPAFAEWMRKCTQLRAEAKARGDEFAQLLYKLVMNGLYGKTAQGLTNKRTAQVEAGQPREPIPKGKVTCPQYAAHCTSLVRAALCEAIDYFQGMGWTVQSATTDGLMVEVPKFEIKAGALPKPPGKLEHDFLEEICPKALKGLRGGAWDAMRLGRKRLGASNLLTLKTWGSEALTVKTRVNAIWGPEGARACAWVGWKGELRPDRSKADLQAKDLLHWFPAAEAMKQDQIRFPGIKEVYEGADYRPKGFRMTLNLDPDYKRQVSPKTGNTRPWGTMGECVVARDYAGWLRKDLRKHPFERAAPSKVAQGVHMPKQGGSKRACGGGNGATGGDVGTEQGLLWPENPKARP